MLALDCVLRPGDPVALASLIKHPLVRLGRSCAVLEPVTHALELMALRGGTGFGEYRDIVVCRHGGDPGTQGERPLSQAMAGANPHRRVPGRSAGAGTRSGTGRRTACAGCSVRDSGTGLRSEFALGAWAAATGRVLEALCADDRQSLALLWSEDSGDALAGLLKDLIEGSIEAGETLVATGPQWADVTTALLAGVGIKPKSSGHPRVFIWGTLEARLQSVDTLVLGGLNEGTWPGATANNPFLSRAMKTEIGLEPPERRIGQSAHDFIEGLGTRKLVLTRALRQGGAPSVASRFVQRLLAVTGKDIADAMRARGAEYLSFAAAIDETPEAERQAFAVRPAPMPEAVRQPARYSFSEVTRLRRDPYAIYARRVLKLDPLDPFNEDPGVVDRGNIYHAIVERFLKSGIDPRGDAAEATVIEIVHQVFEEWALPAHIDAIWRSRAIEMARAFLEWDGERRPFVKTSMVEQSAKLAVNDHLTVSGRADRIDIRTDGRADIIDYKTGASPSAKVARTLLDPQLALEAAVLKGGGFSEIKPRETQDLHYVRLRPGSRFSVDTVNNENGRGDNRRSAMELAEDSMNQLIRLTGALRENKAGFKSRVAPFKDGDHGGEYDHLARVAEWSVADAEGGDADE